MGGFGVGDRVLADLVREQNERCLAVYAEDPTRVEQDANAELRIFEGEYSERQLHELIQNAVDAARSDGSRVEVLLTDDALYVANDGQPFTAEGVQAVMASDLSRKEDDRIGRFGIGFKSVLAISRNPQIFSRSISFEFGRDWAMQVIREAGFEAPRYPVMRLARLLDPDVESGSNDRLASLLTWASTVVALPLAVPAAKLSAQLAEFPREFLLFSPHVHRARFRDETRADPIDDEVGQRADGAQVHLSVGGRSSTWCVVRANHRPSPQALSAASRMAARELIQVQYAVSIPPRASTGQFWAYFPTAFDTTLAGFVNAPWRLSEDRTRLLEGQFNEEILTEIVPQLVGQSLPLLAEAGNPMAAVDALPARGREARNWADDRVNQPIFTHAQSIPSVPNMDGTLTTPSRLRWVDGVELSWLSAWAEVPSAPRTTWVHPDGYRTAERVSKIRRLVGEASGIETWLEALVQDGTAQSSAAAIHLAAFIVRDCERFDRDRRQQVQLAVSRARFIRLENGAFRRPERGRVFVRVTPEDEGHDFVDAELAALPRVTEDLAQLGVVLLDRSGELRALLRQCRGLVARRESRRLGDVWDRIWQITRTLAPETARDIILDDLNGQPELACRVRTADGSWRAIADAYLAGAVVPADGRRDRDRLIDPRYHREDIELLRELGAVEGPTWRHDPPFEAWRGQYEQAIKDLFIRGQRGSKPDPAKLVVTGTPPPWPLGPLASMSDQAKVEGTKLVLSRGLPGTWTVHHSTNASYGVHRFKAPEIWFLAKNGLVETSFGPLRASRAVQPDEAFDPSILPVVDLPAQAAEALGVQESVDDFSANDWTTLKAIADTWSDDDRRAAFYAWLPGRIAPPEALVVRVGPGRQPVAPEYIGVTAERTIYNSMIDARVPALWLESDEDVEILVSSWGLHPGKDLLQEQVEPEVAGEATYLVDEFPPLKLHLQNAEDQNLLLQPCTRIVKMIATPRGQIDRPLPALLENHCVYVTATEPVQQLLQIGQVLKLPGFDQREAHRILEQMKNTAANELRHRIRAAADDDLRLIEAVGVEALRGCVPEQAIATLESTGTTMEPRRVAALARAVHGVDVLKTLSSTLDERGLEPPREWSGRRAARQFCADLGFPIEWAGFPGGSRPAIEAVEGPVTLRQLHEYQAYVIDRIKSLLLGAGPDRGVVSLPTGAGKTRVTIEALVDALRDESLPREKPIVWIAESEELCEQAVETWAYVWRAVGPEAPLSIGRLWSNNEILEEPGTRQVVVATIQKLDSVRQRPAGQYEWVRDASVVVIDEAHGSIAPSYTQVLEWLGRSARSREGRKPLLGLTATPFSGRSDDRTRRLVNRYDGNRLDRGAFFSDDPYEELQSMGVLARVRHEVLDGVDVELEESDRREIQKLRRVPAAVAERLGADMVRNLRIVESIATLPDDWTTLLFAPSVHNSRIIAALLADRGIPSVSISANTDSAARRHYVEQFKAKQIRVLTNYNVLSQGFDAPEVQAVYVTRPTFSPALYQQMIGRGLRGPKNGGSEEVLIVNVRDNFDQYGDLLAFREFEYLWRR